MIVALDHLADPAHARAFSALMQGGDFLIAAMPPWIVAVLHDLTGGFLTGWLLHLGADAAPGTRKLCTGYGRWNPAYPGGSIRAARFQTGSSSHSRITGTIVPSAGQPVSPAMLDVSLLLRHERLQRRRYFFSCAFSQSCICLISTSCAAMTSSASLRISGSLPCSSTTLAMSMAPSWCGIMPFTKSTSASPV